jgi:hypothetical protein
MEEVVGSMNGEDENQPNGEDHAEDRHERLNRELIELLNELRVALPGVQVLFAFLLIVPFSQGFSSVTTPQRYEYFATLLCTAVSTVLLIAPSSQHRLLWRQHERERRLQTGNRLTVAGLTFLALAMLGAVRERRRGGGHLGSRCAIRLVLVCPTVAALARVASRPCSHLVLTR